MPRKRKASKARVGNIQGARDALSGKRQKSTPAGSDISDGDEKRESGDEIVCLSLSKHTKANYFTGRWTT